MKKLQLLPVGVVDARLLEWLSRGAAREISCARGSAFARPRPVLRAARGTQHITRRKSWPPCSDTSPATPGACWGSTEFDLYIPILTFVFGEAQLGGSAALVSAPLLAAGVLIGLPADMDLLANRLLIEAVHELGHTLRLTHCHDYRCAMAPSHAVEWIDIKDSVFCEKSACRAAL